MKPTEISNLPFIKEIIRSGGEVYMVGGNVRDFLLGKVQKDHDLLIRNLPDEKLITVLKPFGRVNRVGKSFGITKFRGHEHDGIEFDLSLPRIEKSTGTGHKDFEVDFDPSLTVEQDLGRRDFTVNAMALDLRDQKIIDPFNGRKDLEQKILRQVFPETFKEDPLRLMRAVQFAARFHLEIEPETLNGMREHAPLIRTVSQERIIDEIRKLFMAEQPSKGFDIMRETGLLKIVFPFVHDMIGVLQPMKRNEDVYQHTMKVLDASRSAEELEKPGDLNIMFAALLHDTGKPRTVGFDEEKERTTFYGHQLVSKRIARKWMDDFRVSCIGVDTEKVLNLVENHMFETKSFYTDRAIRRFVSKVGTENIFDLIDLRVADKKGGKFPKSMRGIMKLRDRIKAELDKKPVFGPKDLALNGHDLINLGFKPGPLLGTIQKFLIEKVLDEPELNTQEKLIELVNENFSDKKNS